VSLHVEEIESIGAVDSGDNPGSFITFWKRKKKGNAASVELSEANDMQKGIGLGNRIRAAREAKDMSAAEVATKLPISASTLSQIERGEIVRPPDTVLAAIASALGMSGLTGLADRDKESGNDNAPMSKGNAESVETN